MVENVGSAIGSQHLGNQDCGLFNATEDEEKEKLFSRFSSYQNNEYLKDVSECKKDVHCEL